jgi:hypothetical protein
MEHFALNAVKLYMYVCFVHVRIRDLNYWRFMTTKLAPVRYVRQSSSHDADSF